MMLLGGSKVVDEPYLDHSGIGVMRLKDHSQTMRNGYICGYGRSHRLFGQRRHMSLAAYDDRESAPPNPITIGNICRSFLIKVLTRQGLLL